MAAATSTLMGGEWTADGDTTPVVDPSDTTQTIGHVPVVGASAITNAAEIAAVAWRDWDAAGPVARGQVLFEAARLVREAADELTDLLMREAGKLRSEARGEALKTADFLEYYAGLGRASTGEILPDARGATMSWSARRPVGVVVAITPWNDPLLTPARKLGPALIAGNAVLLKPATNTPLVAIRLAELLVEAGLPPAVLSVVTGPASATSAPLLSSKHVAAVTFTGSTEVGGRIRRTVSDRNIALQTEMGGKNAAVVLPDADLDKAARTITAAAFAQAGQRCTATSRVIAHDDVADDLIENLREATAALVTGRTDDANAQMGPVISQRHLADVAGHVERAIADGAEVLAGGQRFEEAPLDLGCFHEPTLLAVDPEMRIWRDEVFGPVLSVTTAGSLDRCMELVRDSEYGLSAGLFTTDLGTAMRFVAGADTGQVAVNQATSGWDVQLPFGGFKDSGSAFKEQGTVALDFYTRWQTVAMGWGNDV